MRKTNPRLLVSALVALALAACGAPSQTTAPAAPTADAMMAAPTADAMMAAPTADAMMPEPTADAMMAEPTADAMMPEPTADAMMPEPTADAMMTEPAAELPAWQTLALTDARTGQSFTLADFAGRTVYVEPMATWCSKCREQLGQLREVHSQLDGEQYLFVALSVETTISAADLAAYADEQRFPFTFAVMTPELLQELSATFGRTIANPPATPHFIIRPDGSVTELSTGIKPATEISTQLTDIQGG